MDSSKRTFLKAAFFAINGALAALMGIPILGYVFGSIFRARGLQWVEAGALDDFKKPAPQRKRLKYVSSGFRPIEETLNAWIYTEGDEVTAYSSECPHVGCNVVWKEREGDGIFFCPCHGGEFARTGEVMAGPPPEPLKRLKTKVEGGKVFIEV
jgi:menaquinol-cytochrome c reductase iron-sulfur subunit